MEEWEETLKAWLEGYTDPKRKRNYESVVREAFRLMGVERIADIAAEKLKAYRAAMVERLREDSPEKLSLSAVETNLRAMRSFMKHCASEDKTSLSKEEINACLEFCLLGQVQPKQAGWTIEHLEVQLSNLGGAVNKVGADVMAEIGQVKGEVGDIKAETGSIEDKLTGIIVDVKQIRDSISRSAIPPFRTDICIIITLLIAIEISVALLVYFRIF